MGFQIATAVMAAAGFLLSLVNIGLWLKDRREERRLRSRPLGVFFLRAWTDARHYLIRLHITNPTSINRHVTDCWLDVWEARPSGWKQAIRNAWERRTKRGQMPARRGAVTAAGIEIDPQLCQRLAEFPDALPAAFMIAASQARTGTFAFVRFPWDGQVLKVIDLTPGFFDIRDVSQALAAKVTLVDDRGHKSEAGVFIPWPAPPLA